MRQTRDEGLTLEMKGDKEEATKSKDLIIKQGKIIAEARVESRAKNSKCHRNRRSNKKGEGNSSQNKNDKRILVK